MEMTGLKVIGEMKEIGAHAFASPHPKLLFIFSPS